MNLRGAVLPILLLAAVAAGLAFPGGGSWLDRQRGLGLPVQSWLIIAMFFVYGLRLRWNEMRLSSRWLLLASAALVVNLGLGPLVGLAVATVGRLSEGFFLGLLAMSCVPPTLSSGIVVTENAEGDVYLALFLTLLLTFAGLPILPLTFAGTLRVGLHLSFPLWPFVRRLAGLVLLPVLAGRLFQGFRRNRPLPGWVDLIPAVCVALVVFMPVSRNAESLLGLRLSEFLLLLGTSLAVHGLLLAASAVAGRVFHASRPEWIALLFVASQKTLPLALTALAALDLPPSGRPLLPQATVVCVIFHFSQVLFDSAIGWPLRCMTPASKTQFQGNTP